MSHELPFPAQSLADLDPADPQYASRVVDRLLAAGRTGGASDLHLQATPKGWRPNSALTACSNSWPWSPGPWPPTSSPD